MLKKCGTIHGYLLDRVFELSNRQEEGVVSQVCDVLSVTH